MQCLFAPYKFILVYPDLLDVLKIFIKNSIIKSLPHNFSMLYIFLLTPIHPYFLSGIAVQLQVRYQKFDLHAQ